MTRVIELTPDKFLGDGARKLGQPELSEIRKGLRVFLEMWGIV